MYIKDNYLYFDDEKNIKPKRKISGHTFVELNELGNGKRGDAVLAQLKLYKKDFDDKYTLRGDFAEKLVGAILTYNKRTYVCYNEEEKKANNFDFFPNDKYFGGVPDYIMTDIDETIEVKSKSISAYDFIGIQHHVPKDELYQALLYGYMDKKTYIRMYYVFFDKESEDLIFNGQKPNTLNNLKFCDFQYPMANYIEEIEKMRKNALNYFFTCFREKRIPLNDIKKETLINLGVLNG